MPEKIVPSPFRVFFGTIGRASVTFGENATEMGRLVKEAVYWGAVAPLRGRGGIRWKATVERMAQFGFDSLPIALVIALFIGLSLALQSAYELRKFGAAIFTANLVGVSVTRELGPVFTGILIAGRCGSAITAEIGTMKVNEELDALKTMALNPIRFLVVPIVLALIIMLPFVTVLADLMGIAGGFLVGVGMIDIPLVRFFEQSVDALVMKDFISGLVKSAFFGLIIGVVGCYQGLQVKGGAEGVGLSTTRSVVHSIFLIILANVIFTRLFFS